MHCGRRLGYEAMAIVARVEVRFERCQLQRGQTTVQVGGDVIVASAGVLLLLAPARLLGGSGLLPLAPSLHASARYHSCVVVADPERSASLIAIHAEGAARWSGIELGLDDLAAHAERVRLDDRAVDHASDV